MNAQVKEAQQDQPATQTVNTPNDKAVLDAAVERTQGLVIDERGMVDYENVLGLYKLAAWIYKSKMYPKGLDSPEALALVIARGRSVGLDAFQAMESMGVVNGKVMIYGDAPLAISRQHPAWDEGSFDEYFEQNGERLPGTPKTWTEQTEAVCVTRRSPNGKPRTTRFSVKDATVARIWGKEGPWTNYPQRMLMFRARGYNLRDNFGDALKGIAIRELHEDDELGNRGAAPGAVVPLPTGKGKLADLTEQLKSKSNTQDEPKQEQTQNHPAPEASKTAEQTQVPTEPSNGKDAELQKARKELKESLILLKLPNDEAVAEALKNASLVVKDGGETWIGWEHIDNIKTVRWLQSTTKKLQAMKSQANPLAEAAKQEALAI